MHTKTLFITGAAAGIGRETAKKFAYNGWFIGAADVDEVGLLSLKRDLGPDQCMTFVLDVTEPQQWQSALSDFFARTKRLDVMVNNAGILSSGPFTHTDFDKQGMIIDVNVKGVMAGCYYAHRYLAQTPHACVVNLASASAIYGQPSLATYSASKFAVKGLTEALNLEWEEDDIRVIDMLPLFVATNMVTDMDAQSIRRLGVHLTADDVAQEIFRAVQPGKSYSHVHWTVGKLTTLMYLAANISPGWINRAVNRWITRR